MIYLKDQAFAEDIDGAKLLATTPRSGAGPRGTTRDGGCRASALEWIKGRPREGCSNKSRN